MSRHLDQLRLQLGNAFGDSFRSPEWGAPVLMTQALKQVRAQFDSATVDVDERSIAKTLLAFRQKHLFGSFVDLKYACFGVSQRVGRDEWSLIEDEFLFGLLLGFVKDLRPEPRRLRKCYQGLMHSYFSYPILDGGTTAGSGNWNRLKKFLADQLETALAATRPPTWLRTLEDHNNLLTSKACERYAAALMKGDAGELVAAAEGIGISSNSWLWQEATIAHANAVCKLKDDEEFRRHLKPLLALLGGQSGVQLSGSVVIRCLSMVLVRYAKGRDKPEHARLRDLAVEHIGNPWLKRAAWDAYVEDDDARKMVDGWLKRRLITDFFALLSEDGAADERRLQYWLKFEPVIEDMWFALGSYARQTNTPDFRDMRKRMEGRLHYLDGQGSPYNNAFIMRIGAFMVVEFGVNGNATYIYNAKDMALNPSMRVVRMHVLKAANHVGRLIHNGIWENAFDAWLLPRIGWRPETKATQTVRLKKQQVMVKVKPVDTSERDTKALKPSIPDIAKVMELIYAHNLAYEDMRSKGGAFWIKTGIDDLQINTRLNNLGFRFKSPKGWWRE